MPSPLQSTLVPAEMSAASSMEFLLQSAPRAKPDAAQTIKNETRLLFSMAASLSTLAMDPGPSPRVPAESRRSPEMGGAEIDDPGLNNSERAPEKQPVRPSTACFPRGEW